MQFQFLAIGDSHLAGKHLGYHQGHRHRNLETLRDREGKRLEYRARHRCRRLHLVEGRMLNQLLYSRDSNHLVDRPHRCLRRQLDQ